MRILTKAFEKLIERNVVSENPKETLLNFLRDLQSLEAKLWGVNIIHLKNGEENILEDSNHLIYALSRNKSKELTQLVKRKDTQEFLEELTSLRDDFLQLKRKIEDKSRLKFLISNYTIKSVNSENYDHLEKVFLLEKQLYEVLARQDEEFQKLFDSTNDLRIKKHDDDTTEYFIDALKRIRTILAGHLDTHDLWDEERQGYSNLSNIIHALLKEISKKSL